MKTVKSLTARFVRLLFQRLERRLEDDGPMVIARMDARQGLLDTAEVATVLWEAWEDAKKESTPRGQTLRLHAANALCRAVALSPSHVNAVGCFASLFT